MVILYNPSVILLKIFCVRVIPCQVIQQNGSFHLILTKIHEILWGVRSQASELNKVGIFKIGTVFPKSWTFEILMFFKRIGPKNSWSFAVGTSTDCPLSLNIFIQYFAVKWKAPCWTKQHRQFFTGDLWTLVNHCYKATCFSCGFKHDDISNTYDSNSATSIDFIFLNVRTGVIKVILYLGHPCLFFIFRQKKKFI